MYTIAWLLFILASIVAVPVAALIDAQQRKKAQREAMMGDEEAAEAEAVYEAEDEIVVAEDMDGEVSPLDEAAPLDEALPAGEPEGGLFDDVLPKQN